MNSPLPETLCNDPCEQVSTDFDSERPRGNGKSVLINDTCHNAESNFPNMWVFGNGWFSNVGEGFRWPISALLLVLLGPPATDILTQ